MSVSEQNTGEAETGRCARVEDKCVSRQNTKDEDEYEGAGDVRFDISRGACAELVPVPVRGDGLAEPVGGGTK